MTAEEKLRQKLASQWERAGIWCKDGLVRLLRRSPEEEVWAVRAPGRPDALEVLWWPKEDSYECSCELPFCMHAAAVAQSRKAGIKTATNEDLRIHYSFSRTDGHLRLDRKVPPGAVRTPEDQEMNRLMAGWWAKILPRSLVPGIIPPMSVLPLTITGGRSDGPNYEGPLKVDAQPLLPILRVEDKDGEYQLRLVRASGIDEVFACGLVRMGQTLRQVGKPDFQDDTLYNRLLHGINYGPSEAYRLVVEVIPALRKKLTVEVHSTRLPEVVDAPARIQLEVEAYGDRLRITPRLEYGDPPMARLEQGQLKLSGRQLPIRNAAEEKRLTAELTQLGGMSPGLAVNLTVERSGESALRFLDGMRGWVREEVLKRAPSFHKIREEIEPQLQVHDDGRGGYRISVEAGGASADALLQAWRDGASYVSLGGGGGWRPVPKAWLEQHGTLLSELLSAQEDAGSLPRHAAPMLLSALEALNQPPPASLSSLRALSGDFEAIPDVAPPSNLQAQLRPYQQRGLSWLSWLRSVGMGGILADDMGLGKTLQCLAMLGLVKGRHLIIAPTSVIQNWEKETAKFLPHFRVCMYHGQGRTLDPRADITLSSYAILRLDLETLSTIQWDTLVLDEAQAIKNPDTQIARAAFSVPAAHRLAMTGTPIENRLEELWSAFHFASPGLLGGRTGFRDRFETPIMNGSRSARDALRKRIRPFVLRRMKSEVAKDLPPRTEQVLRCTLSEEERSLYASVRTLGRAEVVKLLEGGKMLSVLEVLLRMRQAACHPGLLSQTWAKGSAKLDLLMETLEEVISEGHRALIFSQWTSLLDRIEPSLRLAGIRFVRLDGSTRDRGAVVEKFEAADGPEVFLLSLKAGGSGLNLTQADYVFHMDPWWNPAVEDQATDRAHRIGQTRPVVSYKLIAEDTVEERILELQARKRDIVKAAFDDEAMAKSLGREDILALFE